MVSSTVIVAGNLAWCVPMVVVLIYLTKRLATNQRFTACQLPLLSEDNLVDHRIDAAKREAEHGYLPCTSCGFENFTRAHFCAICSAPCFDRGEGDDDANRNEDALLHSFLSPQRQLTPLQVRARKRKEWTRKLDLQGRMFWYRSNVDGNDGGLFPGYTVRFDDHREEDEEVQAEPLAPVMEAESKSVENPESPGQDGEEHSEDGEPQEDEAQAEPVKPGKPAFDVSSLTFELLDAMHADPIKFPHGESSDSTFEEARRTLELAEKDFPTKFANFVVSSAVLHVPSTLRHLKLSVHREYVLEESMELISCIQKQHVRAPMRIDFLDESGVDAGGIHREWFMVLNELLMASELGLFKCANRKDQTYFINANSVHDKGDDHLIYYYSTGRLVGRALLDGAVLSSSFCVPLLKMILGVPVSFSDLEYYDAEMYKNLTWMLENDGVEELGLDFSVSEQIGDEIVVTDLIPRGRDIAVTDENKYEYLDRKFRHTLIESVAPQLSVFLKGIYEVIPQRLLMLFDYEELNFLLCGTDEIDVDDWERNTRVSLNLEDNKRVLKWFWEIARGMSSEYRRRLLQFSTGCSRVPLVGFKGLTSYDGRLCPFTLKGVTFKNEGYIRSHACFNMLELPLYKSKAEMKAVLDAILEDNVYGFTTV